MLGWRSSRSVTQTAPLGKTIRDEEEQREVISLVGESLGESTCGGCDERGLR